MSDVVSEKHSDSFQGGEAPLRLLCGHGRSDEDLQEADSLQKAFFKKIFHKQLEKVHSTATGYELFLAVDDTKFCFELVSIQHWIGLQGAGKCLIGKCCLKELKLVCLQQACADKVGCEVEAFLTVILYGITHLQREE